MKLITGYKGFIGKHLLDALPERVYAVDAELVGNVDKLPWDEINTVYHMGAISSTTETDIDLLYRYNVQCTIELFEECFKRNIPIVYASSASVYGTSLTHNINPLNYYAMSKVMIDYKAEEYNKKGADIIGLRFFNVYGEGEDHKGDQASPIHQFTKQAKDLGRIYVFEKSENYYRDFIWVGDVIKCILYNRPILPGIYDVGTSNPISFLEVAELIANKYNVFISDTPFPKKLEGKYQNYTCARKHFDINFTSVSNYLKTQ